MFTFTRLISVCLIYPGLIVILKGYTDAETPSPRRPFSQLSMLDQQICRSRTPLGGGSVQAASANVTTSLSCSVPGGRNFSGKFNFGLGTGVGGGSSGDVVLEEAG